MIERLFAMPCMQTDLGRKAKQRLASISTAPSSASMEPPMGVDAEWLPDHVKAATKTAAKQVSVMKYF